MNKEPKVYVPGKVVEISPRLLKVSMPVEDTIKLIQAHQRDGWIAFCISPRQEVGPKGQTHTAWVDKWKPKATEEQAAQGFRQMKQAVAAPVPQPSAQSAPGDDVPF